MRVPSRKSRTLRVAANDTARDHAAGDRPEPRDPEERAHLDLADDRLGLDRGEHADERLLDLLGQLVDDAVEADLDAGALGDASHLGRRTHVEADDHRARRRSEVDVVLGDPADAGVDHVDAHLGMLDLAELGDDRLDGALHVALDDDVQVLHAAGLHLLEQLVERDAAAALLRHRLAAQALAALLGELARAALVLDDATELAGGRRAVEAEDLDGLARACLLDPLAAIVVERAHAAPGVAGDDRVADLERAAVDEHRRDRAAADVEPRLDDRPGRVGGRVRAQIELGISDEQDALEQVVEVLALLGRDLRDLNVAAPLLRLQAFGRRARSSTRSGFASGRSILFTATTIGTSAARACEIDSLVCGMTPSSAATTSTAMSVTFAPRARIAVNASWPGVSRNVMRRPLWSAWYAPMCCVIPPASVETTRVLRIASSSVVLP